MPPLKVECDVYPQGADPIPSKGGPSTRSPREMEVNYDQNITRLYEAITNEDWTVALSALTDQPSEARTWVVRHHTDGTIMWRFLPIHSACARQPPQELISALLESYRRGASSRDDQGLYPLHYACGNQASADVVRLLLLANPDATREADPAGMLPIHYLAKWGPSEGKVVDMVLFANKDVADAEIEGSGLTPIDLALEGEYAERDEVVAALRQLQDGPSAGVRHVETPDSARAPEREQDEEEEEEKGKEEEEKEEEATPREQVGRSIELMAGTGTPSDDEKVEEEEEEPSSLAIVSSTKEDDMLENATVQTEMSEVRTLRAQKELLAAEAQERREKQTTIVRLRAEISKVRAENKYNEAMMLDDHTREKDELRGSIADLEEKLDEATEVNQTVQKEQGSREEFVRYLEGKLAAKDFELMNLQKENEAMKEELHDVSGRYETLKAGSENVDGHFFALTSSVKALLEEQEEIATAVAKRDELLKKSTKQRQKKMQELINMEVELTKEALLDDNKDGEGDVAAAVQRQTTELESIAAILQAAKDDGFGPSL